MDLARTELDRILGYINPHACCLEDHALQDHRYYFLDRAGVDATTGDTSLHRILALHAPPAAVDHFLQHCQQHAGCHEYERPEEIERTPYYDQLDCDDAFVPQILVQPNRKGVTALHVAVHRNSWHVATIVRMLLARNPILARMPMAASGSLPLHVLTGHCQTVSRDVLRALLQAHPAAAGLEDADGDTPLSLLYKNVLRFRWARCWQVHGIMPPDYASDGGNNSSAKNDDPRDLSWMTVIAPHQFMEYSLDMIRATTASSASGDDDEMEVDKDDVLTWQDVCSTSRCPPLLIRMLLAQQQQQQQQRERQQHSLAGNLRSTDVRGRTALHCVAAAPTTTTRHVPESVASSPTCLELILAAAPEASTLRDAYGRLPLHYALANTTSMPGGCGSAQKTREIAALLRVNPRALVVQDPVTGLYPAQALAALATAGSTSDDLGTSTTDLIYRMLRTSPDVVGYHR